MFEGVDWAAEVWLNGTFVGGHKGYWEPFRLDVTHCLQSTNVLAVRVLDGALLGEPTAGFTVLPTVLAAQPRYVRDASKSVIGRRELFGFMSSCFESGFGIHREVFLETTGPASVSGVFVRGDAAAGEARLQVETDSSIEKEFTLDVQIIPENFKGKTYQASVPGRVRRGSDRLTVVVPTPGPQRWQAEEPCLYRCRVTIRDGTSTVDAQDALFGYRTFRIVTAKAPRPNLPEGMFLLNDQPVFLRGADVSPALNALWYWHEDAKLLDAVLMMKAANFNAVRAGEHVQFAEVRELLDRLGMLCEQDAPGPGIVPMSALAASLANLARACYNNPGVVLLSGSFETSLDPRPMIEAVRAVDRERILKPVSGNMTDWGTAYDGPAGYPALQPDDWNTVIDDFHTYTAWYGRAKRGEMWKMARGYAPGRLVTVGEFGAEALDGYASMQHYPANIQPPSLTADALWGNAQVQKGDPRLEVGLRGRQPRNLGEYIEASQNFQADVLAEHATAFRLSPRRISGSFVFHFIDAVPAEWPKSIVSFDLRPKKGYFALAQVNQPLVPLFQVVEDGKALEVWVANDRPDALTGGRLAWTVEAEGKVLLRGEGPADAPPLDAVRIETLSLAHVPANVSVVTVFLSLSDARGKSVSRYQRDIFLPAWRAEKVDVQPPARALVPRLPDAAAGGDPAKVDWSKAAPLSGWRRVEGNPTKHTIEALIAHDGHHLYVRLSEPVKTADLQSDDGIWGGDDWEGFVGKQRDKPYRQIGVNPEGTHLEVAVGASLSPCAAKIVSDTSQKDRWTVLMALPLDTVVPGGLTSGSAFYGNFCRQTGGPGQYRELLSWTPHYQAGFHVPERFGELTLQ